MKSKMSKVIQGSLATIKEAFRRPIWEEPNLHYDGTEPPKGWLDRLKRLRQIHGYNDKEIVYIAEKCMKGSAQLWFRIHHPRSFEALRTGLHMRFASGPVLVSQNSLPQVNAGRLGSASLEKLRVKKLMPSAVQLDVVTNASVPKSLELVAKSIMLASNDIGKQSCYPNIQPKTTYRSQDSGEDLDSKNLVAQGKSNVASSNVSLNTSKSRRKIMTSTLKSDTQKGDNHEDRGSKNIDATSVSLSSMSRRISAKGVLGEDGSKSLPPSCKTLPINWKGALLKFKHAIHLAMRGHWTQMSADFCKYYLRCYRMRTSGSKRELIHRIRDHLELTDGSGAHKYPRSSFVVECAGVACLGDVILFEQKLRAGFDLLNGNQFDNSIRTVVGRVVKDFKSTSSNQQIFTVEVYWSKGQDAFRPMRPLHITAKDLFSLNPLRQRWINEDARKGLLDEKRNLAMEKKNSDNGFNVAP